MEQARKEYLPRGEKIWNIGPMPVSPRATAGCRRIEQAYGTVLEKLMSRQLDFDLIDRSHFLLSSCAPQGILCQREQYSALVAFAVGQPDNALLEQLYECAFHKIPIVLVTVDGMPVCEDYLALHREYDDMVFLASSEECATLAAQLLPLSEEIKRGPQGDAFEKGRDFTFTRPNPNVWVRETVTEEGEMLLLLHNRGDRPARVEIKIKNGEAPLVGGFFHRGNLRAGRPAGKRASVFHCGDSAPSGPGRHCKKEYS